MIFLPLNFLHSILFFRIKSTKSNADDVFTSVQISSLHQTLYRVLCLNQSLNGRAHFPPPSVIFLPSNISRKWIYVNILDKKSRKITPFLSSSSSFAGHHKSLSAKYKYYRHFEKLNYLQSYCKHHQTFHDSTRFATYIYGHSL